MTETKTGGPTGHRIPRLIVGDVEVHWLRGGSFRLDGGAMFGPVPKPLWRRRFPSDEHNSIPMQAHPLLLKVAGKRLLIDTGLGDKLTDRHRRIFRLEAEPMIDADLAALGLTVADIDFVICTHMDWDHLSGATRADGDELVPTFPNARYVIQKTEWEAAGAPTSRTSHGYWRENREPLAAADKVHIVDGDVELLPGVHLQLTGGHTHGHQVVRVESAGETLLHMGDILPTHAHRNPLWVMGYDNFPLTSIENKEKLLPLAQKHGWWLSFYHDPFLLAMVMDGEGNIVDKVVGPRGWPAVPESS